MLTIRLQRKGKKNQPFFKIVVTEEKKSSTGGRFVEELGFYNPLTKERSVKGDRAKYWMSVGAKPSDTMYNILITEGVIEGKKHPKHKKSKKPAETRQDISTSGGIQAIPPPATTSSDVGRGGETPTEEPKKQGAAPPPTPAPESEPERPAPDKPKEETKKEDSPGD